MVGYPAKWVIACILLYSMEKARARRPGSIVRVSHKTMGLACRAGYAADRHIKFHCLKGNPPPSGLRPVQPKNLSPCPLSGSEHNPST